MTKTYRAKTALLFLFLLAGASFGASWTRAQAIDVSVSRTKAERGQSVEVSVRHAGREAPRAVLLTPSAGTGELRLEKTGDGAYRARVEIGKNAPAGLYLVHAWTGEAASPARVGKSSFRVGNLVTDFFVANYVDKENPGADLDNYLKDFGSIGGNVLIAHNLIIAAGAFYPSKIAKTDVERGSAHDIIEQLLSRADREGFSVFLSVGWDMTRTSPYRDRMKEIKAIISEMHAMYRHHPSLAGFYSWQEGSGTYYASFIREFGEHVKSHDRGLLTACAPHIDDPLLASYLSVIEELDVLIYQSAVMGSYRTDNRKKYPWRRTRDFSGLGAGAKRLQDKITITHVELFGYLEKRISPDHVAASYEDIYGQILSAATVTDTDGISLFAYHAHIYDPLKKGRNVQRSREAVADGLKAYQTVTSEISHSRSALALYLPYSDFVIERWSNYFLPALDAFRALGVPVDILPYAPRMDESVYPYYPIHHNPDVLERLLAERTVLVLANVSGFQQTDSDLLKPFVERGGVVVAFGPQIPMGRTFERTELFGGVELDEKPRREIVVKSALGRRAAAGRRFMLPEGPLPAWRAGSASVVAAFEDGSAAVLVNKYGKGTVITVQPSAEFSVAHMPELIRDVLDHALAVSNNKPLVEIIGTNENFDLAVSYTEGGFSAALVNHNAAALPLSVKPPFKATSCREKMSGARIEAAEKTNTFDLKIPAHNLAVLECR